MGIYAGIFYKDSCLYPNGEKISLLCFAFRGKYLENMRGIHLILNTFFFSFVSA